jgi:hypothetical protein
MCRGARTLQSRRGWIATHGCARLSRLEEHPNPARRVEFEVYIE